MEMDDNLRTNFKIRTSFKILSWSIQDWKIGFVLTRFILKFRREIEMNTNIEPKPLDKTGTEGTNFVMLGNLITL